MCIWTHNFRVTQYYKESYEIFILLIHNISAKIRAVTEYQKRKAKNIKTMQKTKMKIVKMTSIQGYYFLVNILSLYKKRNFSTKPIVNWR